jgi:hypothetical protein
LSIILAAEIDCFEKATQVAGKKRNADGTSNDSQETKQSEDISLANYVELKTYKSVDSDKAEYTWKRFHEH